MQNMIDLMIYLQKSDDHPNMKMTTERILMVALAAELQVTFHSAYYPSNTTLSTVGH